MKLFRRGLCALLSLILVLGLCSCGNSSESEPTENIEDAIEAVEIETNTPDVVQDNSNPISVRVESREEVYPFPSGTDIKSLARIDSALLLLAEEDGRTYLGLCEYSLSEDGRPSLSNVKELNIAEMPFEGDSIQYAVTAGGDGNFYLLSGNSINNASTSLIIQQYNSLGEYIQCMEITGWDLMTVDVFSIGANGEIVLATDNTIYVYRWMKGLLNRVSGDYLVYSSSISGAGLVISIVSLTDHLGHYFLVNSETGNIDELNLSVTDPSGDSSTLLYRVCGSIASCQGLGEEYLMNQGNNICQINFENDTVEPLIEWNTEYNGSGEVGPSCRLGESSFACILSGRLILAWSHMVEKRESGIVRVGVIDGVASQNIAKTVSRMNTADCPYIYEINVYANDDQGLNKFRAELSSGVFDLVVFHNEINTRSSFFEDLYPYLDEDGELSRDSFIPNLLESTSVHGELHQIWNSVMISTMVAREDIVGDGKGLTVADCERLVSENNEIQSLLDNKLSDESALKQDLLLNVAYMAMTAFVDTENASCNFASEEFMNLLSLCDRIKANPDSTGKDFLLYSANVGSANYLSNIEQTFGECSFVGYPDGKDGIHYYQLPNDYEHCMAAAIPSNSLNKEGAWYFIKMLFSRSSQLNIANTFGTGMPVIYDILKETSEYAANERDCSKLYDLLERTKYAELYGDDTLREIIIDSSQAYLAGKKTLEETVQLIQSKANLYISEQFG